MCSSEDFISDEEKSVFDWCQEGRVEKVTQMLISTPDINALDQNVSLYTMCKLNLNDECFLI